ncbi:MAG: hypothetical protein Q7W44_01350 [Coriobacteriia bacterium]|nr:hypothetical protein [Coriobacteriia bacterium]
MSEPGDDADLTGLDQVFRDKAAAEIASAENLIPGDSIVRASGDELADVVLLKGESGPADVEHLRALAGADGEAADKALDALGMPQGRFRVCTRVGDADVAARLERLRLIIEAVDPRTVVALDPAAASDIAQAYGAPALTPGVPTTVGGRRVLALDGLEASLADATLKRRVWRQLQALGTGARTHDGRP